MTTTRTALRGLGVLAAASGLALAGAGVASATTAERDVTGNTVSVEFTLEDGELGDACGALLVPPAAAAELLAELGGGQDMVSPAALPNPGTIIGGILEPVKNITGVVVLENDGAPYVLLAPAVAPSGTVSAEHVPSNLYLQVNICAADLAGGGFAPDVEPVLVGNPLEALGAMSSDGVLDTASALLGAGGGEGDLGAILSSTLGGGQE